MNPMPPGWYPDPQFAGMLRWFDGQQWTDRRTAASAPDMAAGQPWQSGQPWQGGQPWQSGQPWQPGQAPAGGRGSGSRVAVILASVVGGLILLGILTAIALPVFRAQRQKASGADVTSLTCQQVVDDAVAMTKRQATGGQIPLTAVTDPILVDDQRAGLQLPAPGDKAFVMACRGSGQWEDDVVTTVTVRLFLTSDGKHWISVGSE